MQINLFLEDKIIETIDGREMKRQQLDFESVNFFEFPKIHEVNLIYHFCVFPKIKLSCAFLRLYKPR